MTLKTAYLILLLSGISFTAAAQPILVTAFGAKPGSGKDAVPAIRRALAACKGRKSPVLVFPKGRYDLYPDSADRREYFLSNTSSEAECPSKWKTIGILLEGMEGLRIEGEGSLLLYHGKMISFAMDHCSGVVIHHLEIDYARPTMSEFAITRSSRDEVEVRVHPDSWYKLDNGRLVWYGEGWVARDAFCIRVDTLTHAFYYANDAYGRLATSSVTELAPGRLRFSGEFDPGLYPAGSVFTVRDPVRDEVGALILNSKGVTLHRMGMHYMHGLGILSQYSENITMDSVFVEPRKGSGRYIASFADGMHFSGCRGAIRIEHCRFDGLHDDAVNVHGTHLKIVRAPSGSELVVRFMHAQTYGFRAFFDGDSMAFVRPGTLECYAYGKVVHAERLSDREIRLRLAGTIPATVSEGDVVENLTWTPSLTIRHSFFGGTNTRGVLVTTRRKVVIEDNEFYRLGMHAILIADDALSWFESGEVRDVLIRRNIFRENGHNALPGNYVIAIAPENHELTAVPVHRNIRIDSNRFYCYDAPVLSARSVEGLSFTNNIVTYTPPFDKGLKLDTSLSCLRLVSCSKVIMTNNRIDPVFH